MFDKTNLQQQDRAPTRKAAHYLLIKQWKPFSIGVHLCSPAGEGLIPQTWAQPRQQEFSTFAEISVCLPHSLLSSLLLNSFDGPFVDPITFVDQMASSGRLV